jgi:hypothetical protein
MIREEVPISVTLHDLNTTSSNEQMKSRLCCIMSRKLHMSRFRGGLPDPTSFSWHGEVLASVVPLTPECLVTFTSQPEPHLKCGDACQ